MLRMEKSKQTGAVCDSSHFMLNFKFLMCETLNQIPWCQQCIFILSILISQLFLCCSLLSRKTVLGIEDKMYLFSLLINIQLHSLTGQWISAATCQVCWGHFRNVVLQFPADQARGSHGSVVFCCPPQRKLIAEHGNFFTCCICCEQRWMEKDFENTWVLILE